MHKFSCVLIGVLGANLAHSALNIPGITSESLKQLLNDQTLAKTGLSHNEDEIKENPNLVQLTEEQTHEAKVWGLSLDEEKRYVLLMRNRSSIYYRGLRLTPLDILGINARNDDERNHFAELAAAQEAQKVAKNIAWNNAFYKAYNKLFENIPVVGDFDPSPYSPYAHQPIQLSAGDTLYFFVNEHDPVKTILMMLIDAIGRSPNTKLNIMMVGFKNSSIQLWANAHHIPPELVAHGHISLNAGDLNYQTLQVKKKQTPLLLLSKNGHSQVVDLGRF